MFIRNKSNKERGSALVEAALILPIIFMFFFLTCTMSFVALKRNHIQEEMQQTVRDVALAAGGYCKDIAQNILRDRLHYNNPRDPRIMVRTSSLVDGRVELIFKVELRSQNNSTVAQPEYLEKKFRVRIENPDGCNAA